MKKVFTLITLIISTTVLYAQAPNDTVINLKEVVATGTKSPTDLRLLPLTVSVVGSEQLEQRHEPSILPTLTNDVPGLFITNRGMMGYGVSEGSSGSIKVRGIGGMANLLVLIDGLPQYAGLYGHPIADNYLTMMTERVEVVRGPASLYYGSNAMGGVVTIITRQPERDTMMTNIHLQGGSFYTLDAGISNQVRKGRFTSSVGFNYSRTDGHRENMNFDEYCGYVRLGYDISKHWNINATGNVAYFNSSNPGTIYAPIEDNDMHILRGTAALSVENNYDKTSGAIRLYYNGGHHKIDNGWRPPVDSVPQPTWYMHNDVMAGLSAYQSATFFKGNRTTFGFDYQHFGGHAWNRNKANGDDKDIIKKGQYELAGYVDFRQQVAKWFALDAGVRLDWHVQTGLAVIPQGGLSFLLPRDAEIKLTVGRGFRNPTIREMYMYKPANDELKPESMMNYELGYRQHLLGHRLRIGANVFYLHAQNIIESRMVEGRPLNVNTGELNNVGCEVEIAYQVIKGLHLSANYSYLYMKQPIIAAPEHKLNVAAHYHHKRFTIGTSIQYIGGLLTQLPSQGNPDGQVENFVLWNAHASYRIWKGLLCHIKADNLLAQEYEINYGFPMPRTTLMGGVSWGF